MVAIAWLEDGTEESLRSALTLVDPDLANLPIALGPRHASSNPLWWASSAVVDGRFVVKFAWSELRARRLWREGVLLERLAMHEPSLPVPELVVLSSEPALIVTRLVEGVPLSFDWARSLADGDRAEVVRQLAGFLGRLHDVAAPGVLADLDVVVPTPQADTEALRARFPPLVDEQRGATVTGWCAWVDEVLAAGPAAMPGVLVHGDLHGYNQVWDRASATLLTIVDFEESGVADPHYDLRYLPGYSSDVALVLEVIDAYEQAAGRRLAVDRVMAWHLLTALGDALWRTEAGVDLPDGGTATTYVDDLSLRLASLGLE